jgi:hypothetical protein
MHYIHLTNPKARYCSHLNPRSTFNPFIQRPPYLALCNLYGGTACSSHMEVVEMQRRMNIWGSRGDERRLEREHIDKWSNHPYVQEEYRWARTGASMFSPLPVPASSACRQRVGFIRSKSAFVAKYTREKEDIKSHVLTMRVPMSNNMS